MIRWIVTGACVLGAVGMIWAGSEQQVTTDYASFRTSLAGRSPNQKHNAELCVKKINGIVVPPGSTFSFNKTVGPWSRDQGYRRAPVSFGGQLVDAWGGGVCQTSTTLYGAALAAGLPIVSRAAHHYAPTYVAPGRDAAVAYPNIDLAFKNTTGKPLTIRADATGKWLSVTLECRANPPQVDISQRRIAVHKPAEIVLGPQRSTVLNPGKTGYEVETWRTVDGTKELVSIDSYPAMNRVVGGE